MLPFHARVLRIPLLVAASVLVFSGCEPGHAEPPVEKVGGAVLESSRLAGKAGETIELKAISSQLTPSGTCPVNLAFFVDDVQLADKEISGDRLSTLDSNGTCLVTGHEKVELPLPAGTPGTTRDQKVEVLVEGERDGTIYNSTASVVVKVTTAAAPAATPSPTPHATSTPAPTPTPHGPGGGEECGRELRTTGQPPVAEVVVNPFFPIAGEDAGLDGSGSHDPDGHIVAYRWDLDGDWDFEEEASTPYSGFNAPMESEHQICLEVEDDDGNTAYSAHLFPIEPAGSLRAASAFILPVDADGFAHAETGEVVSATPADIAEAESFGVDWGDGSAAEYDGRDGAGDPPVFEHTYTTAGRYPVRVDYMNGAGMSSWTEYVEIVDPSGAAIARAAAKKKVFTVTAGLRQTEDEILDRGEIDYVDGRFTVTDALVRARASGKLDRAQAKKLPRKLRKGLSALYNADFVTRFSGRRVLLTPDDWGLAGTGTILARSRKSRKTLVCMRVTTDGATVEGTTWKILGATGRAKRLSGSGFYPPVVLGDLPGPKADGVAMVSAGKKRGVTKCKALAKHLPKKKRK